jgi:CDP-glucose 4,6-dehydratase
MSDWKTSSVLVTGGTGLVGSWLIERLLREGANVSCLVLDSDPGSALMRSGNINKVSIINGNLSDIDVVSRAVNHQACDTIFHLGAQTIVGTALQDPLNTFNSNIQGTWNVLEVARRSNGLVKRLVVASSDKAYGNSKVLPYTEDMHLHGNGPYDVSKSATDLLAQSYGKTYNLPIAVARCGNIYGGGDLNWSRIVPGTIKSLLANNTPIIRSNGKYLRDYIHVEDIVDAYMHTAESVEKLSLKGEAFNFSRNEPLSVLEIYEEISKATVKNVVKPKILNSSQNEIIDQYLDSSKAKKILGWKSKINLQVGLEKTVAWYREYFNERD